MLKSKKQYEIAKKQLGDYCAFIEKEIKRLNDENSHPVKIELSMNMFAAQKSKYNYEIEEFEKSQREDLIHVDNIYDLPSAIIKARLKAGMSQNELAQKIDIAEQQIQRYETQDYEKANLERVVQIINALGMDISLIFKSKSLKRRKIAIPSEVDNSKLNTKKNLAFKTKQLMVMGE